jgi:hypothetical protein
VAGSLQKSTEVMQAMQSLVRVPEVAATMQALSKEMMRVRRNTFHMKYIKWHLQHTFLHWSALTGTDMTFQNHAYTKQ